MLHLSLVVLLAVHIHLPDVADKSSGPLGGPPPRGISFLVVACPRGTSSFSLMLHMSLVVLWAVHIHLPDVADESSGHIRRSTSSWHLLVAPKTVYLSMFKQGTIDRVSWRGRPDCTASLAVAVAPWPRSCRTHAAIRT